MKTAKQRRRLIQAYYNELVTKHNNEIYNSEEYKNFKGDKYDDIVLLMEERAKIEKQIADLQEQSSTILKDAVKLAGSNNFWSYSNLADDYNISEKHKYFNKLQCVYLDANKLMVAEDRYKDHETEYAAKQLFKELNPS